MCVKSQLQEMTKRKYQELSTTGGDGLTSSGDDESNLEVASSDDGHTDMPPLEAPTSSHGDEGRIERRPVGVGYSEVPILSRASERSSQPPPASNDDVSHPAISGNVTLPSAVMMHLQRVIAERSLRVMPVGGWTLGSIGYLYSLRAPMRNAYSLRPRRTAGRERGE